MEVGEGYLEDVKWVGNQVSKQEVTKKSGTPCAHDVGLDEGKSCSGISRD